MLYLGCDTKRIQKGDAEMEDVIELLIGVIVILGLLLLAEGLRLLFSAIFGR